MNMITKLRELNIKMLNHYDIKSKEYQLQLQIRKILVNDSCFYKIKIETAYSILRDLGIQESHLKLVYKELIKP